MATASVADCKVCGLSMWQQIAIALVLGILAGVIFGENAEYFKVLGTIFIKLIKMVVAPLIFFALIAGITSLTEGHHFRGIAIKGTAAYITTAFLAVCLGLTLASIVGIGQGMEAPPASVVETA